MNQEERMQRVSSILDAIGVHEGKPVDATDISIALDCLVNVTSLVLITAGESSTRKGALLVELEQMFIDALRRNTHRLAAQRGVDLPGAS